jgi:hypothetical protein
MSSPPKPFLMFAEEEEREEIVNKTDRVGLSLIDFQKKLNVTQKGRKSQFF